MVLRPRPLLVRLGAHFWRRGKGTYEKKGKGRERKLKGGCGKGGERDWLQKSGLGLSSLKCGCPQALLVGYMPEIDQNK